MSTLEAQREHFRVLLSRSGYDKKHLTKKFGVSERTVQNWAKYGAPKYAIEYLSTAAGFNSHWYGFKIRDGFIYTPGFETVTKNEIELYQWTRKHLWYAEKRIELLEKAIREMVNVGHSSNTIETSDFNKLAKVLAG